MPILKSNKAVKVGVGIYNATVGKLMGKAKRFDEITRRAYPVTEASATKRMYRGVSEAEAKMYMNGKMPNGKVSWWSDGPDTANKFASKNGNGYMVSADVHVDPKHYQHYIRNDNVDKATMSKRMDAYPKMGYGIYNGHGMNNDSWYSMSDKYLGKKSSNIKVTKL